MNKIALVLLIILVIILSILFYEFYPRKVKPRKNGPPFPLEEVTPSEETYFLEEDPLSEEYSIHQLPKASIQSNLVSNNILNTYKINKVRITPSTPKKSIPNPHGSPSRIPTDTLIPLTSKKETTTLNQLKTQFGPYLNLPSSSVKHLTTSNTCFSNQKDSCPLTSYKQCSNNYPLKDYNSFEICNCNVNKICPYQIEKPQDKPGIGLECPLVFNQENKTLVIP